MFEIILWTVGGIAGVCVGGPILVIVTLKHIAKRMGGG